MQEQTLTRRREARISGNANDRSRANHPRSLAMDMFLGALAGAVGVWAMDRVGWRMYLDEDPEAFRQEKEAQVEGKYVAQVAADRVADSAGIGWTAEQEYEAGQVVHYALGILPGAAYGALRTRVPEVAAARGLLYGFTLFLIQDEVVAPALGLARGPRQYPWQAHVRGLVSHLVLGFATHAVLEVTERARRG